MQENSASTQDLWQLLKPHKPAKKSFFIMFLLVILATGLELLLPLYSSHVVDSITKEGVSSSLILILVAIVLLAALFEGVLAWYGGKMGESISLSLRFSLIGRLLNTNQSAMESQHSAELSARVVNDSKEVKNILGEDLIGLVSGGISLIAVVVVMFVLDWRLTIVLISCVIAGVIFITPLALMMNGIGQSIQTSEANIMSSLTEWLRYSKLIKSHNASSELHQKSKGLLESSFKHSMKEATVLALIGPIANLVLMMSLVSILATSAYWIEQGTMTLGTVTAFLMYLFGLTFPLMAMGFFFSNLHKAAGSAKRLNTLAKLPTENLGGDNQLDMVEQFSCAHLNLVAGDFEILRDVSCDFDGSGLTMIVGESGSGKSSLIQQWLGFNENSNEALAINGMPFNQYSLRSVRRQFAWVDQEPKLIHASVRENLSLGLETHIEKKHIERCIAQAGLSDWYSRIEGDLELMISEQQHQFSGGEKQRFAIARALLRQPKVLLLDEPTSALDSENEGKLIALIRELAKSMRVVMVTHNRQLIAESDHVMTMEKGQLVI